MNTENQQNIHTYVGNVLVIKNPKDNRLNKVKQAIAVNYDLFEYVSVANYGTTVWVPSAQVPVSIGTHFSPEDESKLAATSGELFSIPNLRIGAVLFKDRYRQLLREFEDEGIEYEIKGTMIRFHVGK